jgi:hypothetical protein
VRQHQIPSEATSNPQWGNIKSPVRQHQIPSKATSGLGRIPTEELTCWGCQKMTKGWLETHPFHGKNHWWPSCCPLSYFQHEYTRPAKIHHGWSQSFLKPILKSFHSFPLIIVQSLFSYALKLFKYIPTTQREWLVKMPSVAQLSWQDWRWSDLGTQQGDCKLHTIIIEKAER